MFSMSYLLFVLLNPLACIHECLYPWGHLVVLMVCRIVGLLPWEYGTLQMGHHGEVASVGRSQSGYVVAGAVRVCRIAGVVVFCHNVVLVLRLRQTEVSLAVGYPYSQFVAGQAAEHDRVVLRYSEGYELTFELVAHIVEHTSVVVLVV